MEGHSLPSPNISPEALRKFICEQNIAHYRKCLEETAEEKRRQTLLELLADELARKQCNASSANSASNSVKSSVEDGEQ